MKVCILSMQRVQNFGSLLQAYSLQTIIENLGNEVTFIDIERIEADDMLMEGYREAYAQEMGINANENPLVRKLKKVDKYFVNRLSQKVDYHYQWQLFDAFRDNYLHISSGANSDSYDTCVIGSDEVFNGLQESSWGFTSQLYGNVCQAERVITYAASCGATTLGKTPSLMAKKIAETLRNVSALSVRDQNTLDYVNALGRGDALVHLDPVLVGNFDSEIAAASNTCIPNKPYCLVYAYNNRINRSDEIAAITDLCEVHGLELCSIGNQFWIKNNLVLSPFEILKVFKGAAFVVTDTFHGAIFSSKYTDRFAVIVRPSNANKLEDLVRRIGVEDHLVSDANKLEQSYRLPSPCEKVAEITTREREQSLNYLRDNL